MSDLDARGLAEPVDYEKYGEYFRPTQDGSSIMAFYQFGFRDRISTDGSTVYAAEPGRYHLYLALSCPWSQRSAIAINLLGLTDAISYSLVDDLRDARGWAFRGRRGPDPINNFSFLKQAYLATDPGFKGHVNVPTLWDRKTNRVVNNTDHDIFWDVITQFREWAKSPLDIYPPALRSEIDALDAEIHENLNTGVYKIGMSTNQQEYETLVKAAFDTLGRLEVRLANNRYLFGGMFTETDVRLWVTLARFDIVYNPLFKVNIYRLIDYPNLWAYARDLHSEPAFAELSNFEAMKFMYHSAFPLRNPSRVIPAGPRVDWLEPQDRARMAGRPHGSH